MLYVLELRRKTMKLFVILMTVAPTIFASEYFTYKVVEDKYDMFEVNEAIKVSKDFTKVIFQGVETKCQRAVSDEVFEELKKESPELFELLSCTIDVEDYSDEFAISFIDEGRKADFHGAATLERVENK